MTPSTACHLPWRKNHLQKLQSRVIFAPQIVKRKNNMTQGRGKYASPVQIERRARILSETLKLLEQERPSDISMGQIAALSDVSTKTLYNLFSNRTTLFLAAAARTRSNVEASLPEITAGGGIQRIIELTRRSMAIFKQSPEFMKSTMSVVLGISADEEAEHDRIGRTEKSFYTSLQAAKAHGDLIPEADCAQLAQLLTASQWGTALLWQKDLISLNTLETHAIVKHCSDLMPFCVASKKKWLETLMFETLNIGQEAKERASNGVLEAV
jgi:AcrR family transcriptional regulator